MVCVYRRRTIVACMPRPHRGLPQVTDACQRLASLSLVYLTSLNRSMTINMTVLTQWRKNLAHVTATCLLLVIVFDGCRATSKYYLASCISLTDTLR